MSSAVAGLIGAVVGGVLSVGANVVIEATRNRRADKETTVRELSDRRQAARLVWAELKRSRLMVNSAKDGKWPSGVSLPTQKWLIYGDVLAAQLRTDEWEAIEEAFNALEIISLNDFEETPSLNALEGTIGMLDKAIGILNEHRGAGQT
jgi:hypothetical protein